MAKVTLDTARTRLLWLWFGFLILDMALTVTLLLADLIDSMLPLAEMLSQCFAPYLGAILAFFYAGPAVKQDRQQGTAYHALLVGSALWHLMITGVMVMLLFRGNMDDSIQLINRLSAVFAWLVAGGVGYFFSAQSGD